MAYLLEKLNEIFLQDVISAENSNPNMNLTRGSRNTKLHHIKASDLHEVLDILGSVDPEVSVKHSSNSRKQFSESRGL